MSQSNTHRSDDPGLVNQGESPGTRLRLLRQSRGLDIERVAAQLHLARPVVEAMEQDRFESLPSPVFVVGYLRNYARLLGTDPMPIVLAYRSLVPSIDPPLFNSLDPTAGASAAGGRWGWLMGLLLVGLAAALGGLWWSGWLTSSEAPEMSSAVSATEDTLIAAAPGQTEPAGGSPAAPGAEVTESSVTAPIDSYGSVASVPAEAIPLRRPDALSRPAAATEPAPTSAEAAEAPPIAASEPEPEPKPPAAAEVVLEFSGASWVDVRGADGKVVLNGEMRSGDRRVLTGQPPFKLVIGNAAATQMTVAGQAFDLKRRAQGNVARFTLDPSAPE